MNLNQSKAAAVCSISKSIFWGIHTDLKLKDLQALINNNLYGFNNIWLKCMVTNNIMGCQIYVNQVSIEKVKLPSTIIYKEWKNCQKKNPLLGRPDKRSIEWVHSLRHIIFPLTSKWDFCAATSSKSYSTELSLRVWMRIPLKT